jgi:uncharacterized protein (TIGR00369 family)
MAPLSSTSAIAELNRTAPFNVWSGIEVRRAEAGEAEIRLAWRPEFAQYAGFLHAGLVGALIDTACGYAAATVAGRVLAAHFGVNCLRPAVGTAFVARARVVKAGRSQVFTSAELHAVAADGAETLVASGETLLTVIADR